MSESKYPESCLSALDVTTLAKVAGIHVDLEEAERVASSIGPGLQWLRPIAGTLPFDLEPASFIVAQNGVGA